MRLILNVKRKEDLHLAFRAAVDHLAYEKEQGKPHPSMIVGFPNKRSFYVKRTKHTISVFNN